MPSGVLDVLWTAVFLVGIALALYCLLTIHRSPYFSEVQKLKWLLFTLALPFLGPIAWILRSRAEKREAAQRPSPDTQDTQPPSNDAP